MGMDLINADICVLLFGGRLRDTYSSNLKGLLYTPLIGT